VDFEALDVDDKIVMAQNYLAIDPSSDSVFDVPSEISLYNVNIVSPIILRNGNPCLVCQITNNDEVNVTFTAPGAGTYTVIEGNQPPVADAGEDMRTRPGRKIQFDGTGSHDPDGDPLTYDWNFGDGSAHAQVVSPYHKYLISENFTATLRVTDNHSGLDSDQVNVDVRRPNRLKLVTRNFVHNTGDLCEIGLSSPMGSEGRTFIIYWRPARNNNILNTIDSESDFDNLADDGWTTLTYGQLDDNGNFLFTKVVPFDISGKFEFVAFSVHNGDVDRSNKIRIRIIGTGGGAF